MTLEEFLPTLSPENLQRLETAIARRNKAKEDYKRLKKKYASMKIALKRIKKELDEELNQGRITFKYTYTNYIELIEKKLIQIERDLKRSEPISVDQFDLKKITDYMQRPDVFTDAVRRIEPYYDYTSKIENGFNCVRIAGNYYRNIYRNLKEHRHAMRLKAYLEKVNAERGMI